MRRCEKWLLLPGASIHRVVRNSGDAHQTIELEEPGKDMQDGISLHGIACRKRMTGHVKETGKAQKHIENPPTQARESVCRRGNYHHSHSWQGKTRN